MDIETFGVTVEMMVSRVQGLSIDPTSTPSPETVEDIILSAAAEVVAVAKSVGIQNWDPTDETYRILQNMVLYLSAAEVIASRDRGEDRASYYRSRYKDMMKTLEASPQRVQPGGQTTQRNKGVISTPDTRYVDRLGLGRRLLY